MLPFAVIGRVREVTMFLVAEFGGEQPRSSAAGSLKKNKSATEVDSPVHQVDVRQYA